MSDIDPAAIMAEHEDHAEVGYNGRHACVPHDLLRGEQHCEPYRLASALAEQCDITANLRQCMNRVLAERAS